MAGLLSLSHERVSLLNQFIVSLNLLRVTTGVIKEVLITYLLWCSWCESERSESTTLYDLSRVVLNYIKSERFQWTEPIVTFKNYLSLTGTK